MTKGSCVIPKLLPTLELLSVLLNIISHQSYLSVIRVRVMAQYFMHSLLIMLQGAIHSNSNDTFTNLIYIDKVRRPVTQKYISLQCPGMQNFNTRSLLLQSKRILHQVLPPFFSNL